jgi:bacteriocin biosynthesis cyclodehydratase domain-containing protein
MNMGEDKYYVSPGLQVVRIDESRLSLNLYGRRFTLKDETGLIEAIFESAVPDGFTVPQLLENFPGAWPSEVVDTVMQSLCKSNFLHTSDRRTPPLATMDFLAHSANLADKVVSGFGKNLSFQEWSVLVAGEGDVAAGLGAAFDALQVAWAPIGMHESVPEERRHATLLVVCSDSMDHSLFRKWNRFAVAQDVTSIYASVDAHIARCGPVVVPKANACYECYFHRVSSTRTHIEEFEAASDSDNVICQPTPNVLSIHWGISAALTKILAILSGLGMDLHLSPLQEVNVFSGEVSNSKLLKIPRCPVCGTANGNRPFSAVINTKLALKAG